MNFSIVQLEYYCTERLNGSWGTLFNGELGYLLGFGMTPYEVGIMPYEAGG
jgi:hypothetical protein